MHQSELFFGDVLGWCISWKKLWCIQQWLYQKKHPQSQLCYDIMIRVLQQLQYSIWLTPKFDKCKKKSHNQKTSIQNSPPKPPTSLWSATKVATACSVAVASMRSHEYNCYGKLRGPLGGWAPRTDGSVAHLPCWPYKFPYGSGCLRTTSTDGHENGWNQWGVIRTPLIYIHRDHPPSTPPKMPPRKSPAENRAFYKGQWWGFFRGNMALTWGFLRPQKIPMIFKREKCSLLNPDLAPYLETLQAEWIRVAVVIGWWYSFGCQGFRGWNSQVRWHGKGIKSGMILHLLNFHKDISNPGWFY